MINDSIINAVEIHGEAGANLTVDTLSCSVQLGCEYSKVIIYESDSDCVCSLEATFEITRGPTASLVCSGDLSIKFLRKVEIDSTLGCDSNMPLTSANRIIAPYSDIIGTCDTIITSTYYRKGKPMISFNKYSIRRAGGHIVILKDEYI